MKGVPMNISLHTQAHEYTEVPTGDSVIDL